MTINIENIWKIYYYVGIFATILFALKVLLFSVFGGDSEVFADFNTETETECSFNFFSTQSVIAFFMGLGWTGYACLQQFGFGQPKTFLISFAAGLVFMFVSAFLMFSIRKLEKKVDKNKESAIGKQGKAYTNFEPQSPGRIEIEINGQLSVVEAMNETDDKINSFEAITVTRVENDTLYIKKI